MWPSPPEHRLHEDHDCILLTISEELVVQRTQNNRVLVSWAAVMHYHNLGGLKQQKLILSQFWRLDIGNQGDGRAALLLASLGENPSPPRPAAGYDPHALASEACGHITPVSASVFTEPSLLYGFSSSVFYKDICHWIWGLLR